MAKLITSENLISNNNAQNIYKSIKKIIQRFDDADVNHIDKIEINIAMFSEILSYESFINSRNVFVRVGDEVIGKLFGHEIKVNNDDNCDYNFCIYFDKKYVRYKKIYSVLNDVKYISLNEKYKYYLYNDFQKIKDVL